MNRLLDPERYGLARIASVPSPRLVVVRPIVESNIAAMRGYLEAIVPGSGFEHLRAHVKTHKSAWTTRLQMAAGIRRFKCTPNELDMLVDAGARDIFVAYPLLAREADRLARLIARCPEVRFRAQVGAPEHCRWLASAAARHGVEIPVLIDVDVGNRRTGTAPELVETVAREILSTARLGALKLHGLHAYDGHNHSPSAAEREELSAAAMRIVADCARRLETLGAPPRSVVVAGSPPFREDLHELTRVHALDAHVEVSPGTWIYWDTRYDGIVPGLFEIAAVVFAQVMDSPAADLVTLNLGHKRWAIDQGPVERFSIAGLELVAASEEHTVLRRGPGSSPLRLGEPLLLAPRHVCATVNLWEHFVVVGASGIESAREPVTARNR